MRRFSFTLSMATVLVSPLAAQTDLPASRAGAGDAEVAVVLTAALQQLSARIAIVAMLPDSTPLQITVPDPSLPAWRKAEDAITTFLHARPVRESDRHYWSLSFDKIRIIGDSLFGRFALENFERCPVGPPKTHPMSGKEMATGGPTNVTAVRQMGYWEQIRTKPGEFWEGWCIQMPDKRDSG